MKTEIFFSVLCGILVTSDAWYCPEKCEESRCPQVLCKGSLVKEVCGCCDVCAKLEGEECGGYKYESGICEPGLTCWDFVENREALPYNPYGGACVRLDS